MISYEASKWYVKLWRHRWYIYAIYLHFVRNYLKLSMLVDFVVDTIVNGDDLIEKEKLRENWKDIKKSVELSKMHKFSSKNQIIKK